MASKKSAHVKGRFAPIPKVDKTKIFDESLSDKFIGNENFK